jgi:glucose/arabinose dehydrogenase
MSPASQRWLRLGLATLILAAPAAHAGHSLRFGGTGTGDVDRVKIRIDDPATSTAGPKLDVGANDFTIELWVKGALVDNAAPAITCGANTAWVNGNIVLDRDRYNQDRKFGLSFGNGRAVFGISGAGTGDRTICGTINVLDGQWHHVAVQRRRSDGYLWLFVDGTLEAQIDGPDGDVSYPDNGVPGDFCGGPCTNSDPFLVIGAEKHDAGPAFPSFNGYVDELRVSTTLRYPNASFSRPRAPFVPDTATVALYHFDEGLGGTLYDVLPQATGASDGQIRRASPTAFPQWSTDTPFNALQAIGASTISFPQLATGLSAPVDVVPAADASGATYIVQQGGLIRIHRNGAMLATPFLDLTGKTSGGGERGLLSMAFHPDYLRNGRFFVYYTRSSDGALTVERYTRNANNADIADPASAASMLSIPHSAGNHNGGKLAFGADGYLYIGTGDSGGGNDPANVAQNLSSRLGKMLRVDVDGTNVAPYYTIPATNPFAGQTCNGVSVGTCPEIWAYGLRNPWRYSFDRLTGDLYIGDVGQGDREEVDFEAAGSAGGKNFGWRIMEGTICTPGVSSSCTPPGNHVPPILEYTHATGFSITGGFRYRGSRIPALAGAYLYADYVSQPLWAGTVNGAGAWTATLLQNTPTGISAFGEDRNGELYAAGLGNGIVYRLAPRDTDGDGLPDWWETAYFGSGTAGLPNDDTDGDGYTNLAEYLAGSDPLLATSIPIRALPLRDFDASGGADLLWRSGVNGQFAIWNMDGVALRTTAMLAPGADWQVTHTADFNADRRQDLIWRNGVTGETALWFMSGTAMTSGATLLTDPAWRVTHTGDFDGDGRADLVWRNDSTGTTSVWLMNGTTMSSGRVLLVNVGWQVTLVADLNGDGRSDLVWRNDTTGETAVWLMNGATFVSGAVVLANAAWRAILTGDFNGDGRADLVWNNATTGETALWLMNGATFVNGAIVLANTAWTPTHAVDLDGNGKTDLVWRNSATGGTNAWLMNGLTLQLGGAITVPGSVVQAAGDYDGDGRADLVWYDAASGLTQMGLMDGLTVSRSSNLLSSTDWTVRP